MFKLKNQIKNYAWGSRTSISKLFCFENPSNEPQAEIWMGAHSGGCSLNEENSELLSDVIEKNKNAFLGFYTVKRFGELPYLFKVLAAHTPLSIQVHPSKRKSELGFARENEQGIALNDPARNYKDPNHKPELVYALTPYKAMNGFRPIEHIIRVFDEIAIDELNQEVEMLKQEPNSKGLRRFFSSIMMLNKGRKEKVFLQLDDAYCKPVLSSMAREAKEYSQDFKKYYEGDIGLLAPFFLNIVELEPGEAMFLFAETPHAYIHGTALEVMASSDNVIRAGLTSKHIDLQELILNTRFVPTSPENIKLPSIIQINKELFPVPVDDFSFDIFYCKAKEIVQFVRSPEILFCIDGNIQVLSGDKKLDIKAGESVFVPYNMKVYRIEGVGKLARVYN